LRGGWIEANTVSNLSEAVAFDLVKTDQDEYVEITDKGKQFFKWFLLNMKTDKK
jgi:hypothetical protein